MNKVVFVESLEVIKADNKTHASCTWRFCSRNVEEETANPGSLGKQSRYRDGVNKLLSVFINASVPQKPSETGPWLLQNMNRKSGSLSFDVVIGII